MIDTTARRRAGGRVTGRPRSGAVLLCALVLLAASGQPRAQDNHPQPSPELAELSLEELMNLEVTSLSRASDPLEQAAAAAYVITAEDIRRSGATNIPEVLRLAPGLHVVRIDAHKWAVSIRGQNGRFTNRLLVMIDDRTTFSPFFGGVLWDQIDLLLDDIERIEIIRGPGSAVWGTNAVNGVINIITKSSEDTPGAVAKLGAGDQEDALLALRVGGRTRSGAHFRAWGKAVEHSDLRSSMGGEADDSGRLLSGGLRLDRHGKESDLFVCATLFDGRLGAGVPHYSSYPTFFSLSREPVSTSGGHLQAQYTKEGPSGPLVFRGFYDRSVRDEIMLGQARDTVEFEYQQEHRAGQHRLIWGASFRRSWMHARTTETATAPSHGGISIASAFLQHEMKFAGGRARLSSGSKFEHNSFTGLEVQPTLRLSWQPATTTTVWGAVTRSVQIPSSELQHATVQLAPFVDPGSGLMGNFRFSGNENLGEEDALVYEAGLRGRWTDNLTVDLASFATTYYHGATIGSETPFIETDPLPPHLVVPLTIFNGEDLHSHGGEISFDWRPADWLRLTGSWSTIRFRVEAAPDAIGLGGMVNGVRGPRSLAVLRTSIDLPRSIEADLALRYSSPIRDFQIEGFTTADLRLAIPLSGDVELSLIGRNLLDDGRVEFADLMLQGVPSLIERSFLLQLRWRH